MSHASAGDPASGRSSPLGRPLRRPIEDGLYKKDKGFRRYAAGVDRALALFDTNQQVWADYISFLSRLLKAIQAHPNDVPVIPHSNIVATRLAQCMNPSLPAGVHQKTIELYAYIFSVIGPQGLSRDLYLYLPGLTPALSFAALSVRPAFLSLVEKHFLTLESYALRPALRSIILSLLPGLEDESSEDFERVLSLLDSVKKAVGDSGIRGAQAGSSGDAYFWQCFFLASITNASRRQGALAYMLRKLPKLGPSQSRRPSTISENGVDQEKEACSTDAEAVITPEPGLLIRCFAAGLSDPQLLTQRGFLDLLVTHLPLHAPVFKDKVSAEDLDKLVAAATGVVSRRDMSLNRRLWSWFLGPDPPSGMDPDTGRSPTEDERNGGGDFGNFHAEYFSQFGLRSLHRSIMSMIKTKSDSPTDRARPFRICLSLMDRWEVGGLIVPETFLPALESAFDYSERAEKKDLEEVLRSASNYFDGVESGLIWGKLHELLTYALAPKNGDQSRRLRKLKLAKFIITKFNVREEEMLIHHIPLVTSTLLILLIDYARNKLGKDSGDDEILLIAFGILEFLLGSIPARALNREARTGKLRGRRKLSTTDRLGILKSVHTFYAEDQGNLDMFHQPLFAKQISDLILLETAKLFIVSLTSSPSRHMSEVCTKQICSAIQKAPDLEPIRNTQLLEAFHNVLRGSGPKPSRGAVDFSIVLSITAVIMSLQTTQPERFIDDNQISDLMPPLITTIWYHLSPFRLKYHVEAVRCLWQLQALTAAERRVEAAITSIMAGAGDIIEDDYTSAEDIGRRFAVLWTHTIYEFGLSSEKGRRRNSGLPGIDALGSDMSYQSVLTRPLMILLDSLADDSTGLCAFVRSWLQDLPSLNRVFDVLVGEISQLRCLRASKSLSTTSFQTAEDHFITIDDSAECLYYLQHVVNVLKWPTEHIWNVLAKDTIIDTENSEETKEMTFQGYIAQCCMQALHVRGKTIDGSPQPHIFDLHRTALLILRQLLCSPFAEPLKAMQLEVPLIDRLISSLDDLEPLLQTALLEAILAALQLRLAKTSARPQTPPGTANPLKSPTEPNMRGHRTPSISVTADKTFEKEKDVAASSAPPPKLLECLRAGFSSPKSRVVLDSWVAFLGEVLPLYTDTVFQNLLPLVGCFCEQIGNVFNHLKTTFREQPPDEFASPEPTLIALMHGLEQILAQAHERLVFEEVKTKPSKSPEQPQGFFGNVVGVFASETPRGRSATANDRLTVLLCFQDTVRICFSIWSWNGYNEATKPDPLSLASFNYTSLRMRNRARRILEHLFAAESLESLETLAVMWCHTAPGSQQAVAIISLLNVLNGSRPKNTIPAIFNAVYSRTNPDALDPNRMSTLTSDLADTDLVSFLVDYTLSLEDDAMDEIWPDCMTFLRDVLSNPMPHRQILPTLLEFTAMLAEKVDNTNFGEQKKMRRELGDIFMRLLTATFTTRSMAFLQDPSSSSVNLTDKIQEASLNNNVRISSDIVTVLAEIIPRLSLVLVDNDKVANAVTSISTNILGPAMRAKAFPTNLSTQTMDLSLRLTRITHGSKLWKKDIFDAFNDPKFFLIPQARVQSHWLQILRQWSMSDKERMPELLSRLSAPTTAGIMFGVGATSARLEADRRTQFTLRRMAVLILAAPEDTFVPNIRTIEEKLAELLTATAQSSPSSNTRAEVFLLLRALVLQTSPTSFAPLWPAITTELRAAISSLAPDSGDQDRYNNDSLLQACKLLDILVTIAPDDFQLQEWLFITDTIDSVYRPDSADPPAALADEIAEALGDLDAPTPATGESHSAAATHASTGYSGLRRPYLDTLLEKLGARHGNGGDITEEGLDLRQLSRQDLVVKVLRPFLSQLSLWGFEATYAMAKVDLEAVKSDLLVDLFDIGESLE